MREKKRVLSSSAITFLLLLTMILAAHCRPVSDGEYHTDGDADSDVDSDSDVDADSDADADTDSDSDTIDGNGCTEVDILFVIDDSGSMKEEQENLARNFPEFIRQLEAYRTPADTQLDYRVGITTTSRANFRLNTSFTTKQGAGPCTTTDDCTNTNHTCECPAGGFVECSDECTGNCFCEPPGMTMPMNTRCNGEDGALITPSGYTEPWIDGPGDHVSRAFSSTATVGTGGCGLEMPLYAVEHALSINHASSSDGPNDGFLRENSLLMLIIITDEDDCSTELDQVSQNVTIDINHMFAGMNQDNACTHMDGTDINDDYLPIEHYLDFLDNLMHLRSHWAAAVIAGETSCSSSFGDAYTAYRLRRFVESAGDNAVFSDICAADLTDGLEEALDVLQVACDEFIFI